MMRYQLVRMDGPWLKVALTERQRGYPDYAREHVDPLAVLRLGATKSPDTEKRPPPAEPPRLSAVLTRSIAAVSHRGARGAMSRPARRGRRAPAAGAPRP